MSAFSSFFPCLITSSGRHILHFWLLCLPFLLFFLALSLLPADTSFIFNFCVCLFFFFSLPYHLFRQTHPSFLASVSAFSSFFPCIITSSGRHILRFWLLCLPFLLFFLALSLLPADTSFILGFCVCLFFFFSLHYHFFRQTHPSFLTSVSAFSSFLACIITSSGRHILHF